MIRTTVPAALLGPAGATHVESNHKEEAMSDTITETTKPDGAPPPAGDTHTEPATDTAPKTDSKTAEVVDLDKVRAEARGEGAAEAARVADLCALAGMPERTGEMIARRLSADEVRRELLTLKAGEDSAEVRSHLLPGSGTGQPVTLDDNPVVRAAKARAAAAKEA